MPTLNLNQTLPSTQLTGGGFANPNNFVMGTPGTLNVQNIPRTTNIGELQQMQLLSGQSNSGKIFQAFNQSDDVISNIKQKVTETMWSSGDTQLTGSEFYFNSTQISASVEYYVDVYCYDPSTSASATPQFSFGFGDRLGRGTVSGQASSNWGLSRTVTYQSSSYSPTACIYSQYRNLILAPTDEQFTLGNGQTMDSFYFVNFSRNRMKERLDSGNWELITHVLKTGGGFADVHMIDDAGNETVTGTVGDGGRIYNIISGSIANGAYLDGNGNKVYMGKAYPDIGVLLFNATGSTYTNGSSGLPFTMSPTTDYAENNYRFWSAITDANSGFAARNSQEITSTYYFVRIKHNDFNFSNNPSFVSGSLGDFRHSSMINSPSVYITTVGLYNDANELLAVAKLSKPLLKTFERESLIRIKLDF